MKTLFAYADGASIALPKEIVSDWTTGGQGIVAGTGEMAGTVRGM